MIISQQYSDLPKKRKKTQEMSFCTLYYARTGTTYGCVLYTYLYICLRCGVPPLPPPTYCSREYRDGPLYTVPGGEYDNIASAQVHVHLSAIITGRSFCHYSSS